MSSLKALSLIFLVFLTVGSVTAAEQEKDDGILVITESTFQKTIDSIEHVLVLFFNHHEYIS
jgi:hypothetical protein